MLSHGNMMPDSIMVGIVSPIPHSSIAVCCVLEMTDTSSPSPSDEPTKTSDTRDSSVRLPWIGTPMTKWARSRTLTKLTTDRARYGIILERIIQNGLTGDTRSSSSVPVSFSFTMDTAVIIEQISIRIKPMTPGTKL